MDTVTIHISPLKAVPGLQNHKLVSHPSKRHRITAEELLVKHGVVIRPRENIVEQILNFAFYHFIDFWTESGTRGYGR